MIGLPYTKYMNSIMRVNQSSAIIVMSAKKARELGIPESKWIFMYSGACLNDVWNVSNRTDYYSSPAIKSCTDSVFDPQMSLSVKWILLIYIHAFLQLFR